jgi:hypothetical protein
MKTKHTQGEWVISHGANFTPTIGSAVLHQPIAHLCNMTDTKKFCEEAEANAKLIAAAPELLQALIKANNLLQGLNIVAEEKNAVAIILSDMQDAINKATK